MALLLPDKCVNDTHQLWRQFYVERKMDMVVPEMNQIQ